MAEADAKRANDELNAVISIKEREFSRAYDEAQARGDEEGMEKALDGYRAMLEILDDLLAFIRF